MVKKTVSGEKKETEPHIGDHPKVLEQGKLEKKPIEKSAQPLSKAPLPSQFSIKSKLEEKNQEVAQIVTTNSKNLPSDHFTETDLQSEWQKFLLRLKDRDIVCYNAISGFLISKKDEDVIEVHYPTDSAKSEFDKVKDEFFNHFRHKVNHFQIEVSFTKDEVNLKNEIVTKRTVFERFLKINPLLKDLDDLMKFDFS